MSFFFSLDLNFILFYTKAEVKLRASDGFEKTRKAVMTHVDLLVDQFYQTAEKSKTNIRHLVVREERKLHSSHKIFK